MSARVPDISKSVIAEYEQLECSPRWFLSFQGDLMEKEKDVWEWVERSCNATIMALGEAHTSAFAADPVIVKDLYTILQQWFIRGFYMGIRRYTSEISIGMGPLHPLSEPNAGKKKKPQEKDGEVWSENAELDLSDFDDPRVEKIEDDDEGGAVT